MALLKGLLWFDNDPQKDWRQKVRDAAQAHLNKFWIKANVCYINPAAVQPEQDQVIDLREEFFVEEMDGIEVYTRRNTLRHHFYIGYREIQQIGRVSTPTGEIEQPVLF
jgi:hypothetical protein